MFFFCPIHLTLILLSNILIVVKITQVATYKFLDMETPSLIKNADN